MYINNKVEGRFLSLFLFKEKGVDFIFKYIYILFWVRTKITNTPGHFQNVRCTCS